MNLIRSRFGSRRSLTPSRALQAMPALPPPDAAEATEGDALPDEPGELHGTSQSGDSLVATRSVASLEIQPHILRGSERFIMGRDKGGA